MLGMGLSLLDAGQEEKLGGGWGGAKSNLLSQQE